MMILGFIILAVNIGFGDGETTGIVVLKNPRTEELKSDTGWYSLDGRRLDGKPTQRGVYINDGRKVVIK